EAARWIGEVTGDRRRVDAVARGTQIAQRAICLPPEELSRLATIEDRNLVYQEVAPALALHACRDVLAPQRSLNVGLVVAVSCTGYMVPGWDTLIAREFELSPQTVRLP